MHVVKFCYLGHLGHLFCVLQCMYSICRSFDFIYILCIYIKSNHGYYILVGIHKINVLNVPIPQKFPFDGATDKPCGEMVYGC